MYRALLYITLLFFFSLTLVAKAEVEMDSTEAYCAKYEECREARWQDLKKVLFEDIDLKSGEGVIELSTPKRAPDAAFVPMSFKTHKLKNQDDYIAKVHLVVDMNPAPYSGTFKFSTSMNQIELATRIRLDAYSKVRVIAETKKGDYFMTANFVKGSGGCAAPPLGNIDNMIATAGKIKIKVKNIEEKDGIAEAKIMISHPQFNGLQANPETTEMIPAYYVENVKVTFNDKIVMSLDSDITISQDPTFRFNFPLGDGGGDLKIMAKDTDGKVYTHLEKLALQQGNQLKLAIQQ
jgi:sulfur-oxidizing protein SoxY